MVLKAVERSKEAQEVRNALSKVESTDIVMTELLRKDAKSLLSTYETYRKTKKVVFWRVKIAKNGFVSKLRGIDPEGIKRIRGKLAKLSGKNELAKGMLSFLDERMSELTKEKKIKPGQAAAAGLEIPAIPEVVGVGRGETPLVGSYVSFKYRDNKGKTRTLNIGETDLALWALDFPIKTEFKDTSDAVNTLDVLISMGKIKLDEKTGELSVAKKA